MSKNFVNLGKVALLVCVTMYLTGCSIALYSRYPRDKARIAELSQQLTEMEKLKAQETEQLKQTLEELQRRLGGEEGITLGLEDRGLIITFVDEVLFDSGKAVIKPGAYDILNKVADILKTKVSFKNSAIALLESNAISSA